MVKRDVGNNGYSDQTTQPNRHLLSCGCCKEVKFEKGSNSSCLMIFRCSGTPWLMRRSVGWDYFQQDNIDAGSTANELEQLLFVTTCNVELGITVAFIFSNLGTTSISYCLTAAYSWILTPPSELFCLLRSAFSKTWMNHSLLFHLR